MDRPVKRRFEILIGRYTANPMMRGLFKLGITPPGMALFCSELRAALTPVRRTRRSSRRVHAWVCSD